MAAATASGYIEHHLQNLSLAKLGFVEETSFWNVHIDSLFFSVLLVRYSFGFFAQ